MWFLLLALALQLATRLCHYLRPKIHPLLLDATINSPQTVCLNIYQVLRGKRRAGRQREGRRGRRDAGARGLADWHR